MRRSVLILAVLLIAGCGKPVAPAAAPVSAAGAQAQGLFNQPVPLEYIVRDVLDSYDHNRNGVIDLRRPDGFLPPWWQTADERTRKETTRREERDGAGRPTRVVYTTYTYDRHDFFAMADLNDDGAVTRDELWAVARSFDADKDGKLSRRGLWGWITGKEKLEHDKFQAQYGERQIDVRHDVINLLAAAQIDAEANIVEAPTEIEDPDAKPTQAQIEAARKQQGI